MCWSEQQRHFLWLDEGLDEQSLPTTFSSSKEFSVLPPTKYDSNTPWTVCTALCLLLVKSPPTMAVSRNAPTSPSACTLLPSASALTCNTRLNKQDVSKFPQKELCAHKSSKPFSYLFKALSDQNLNLGLASMCQCQEMQSASLPFLLRDLHSGKPDP